MDLVVFEENKPLVLQALHEGEFDYVDAASEVFETEFFRHISTKSILAKLADSYPTPRKKHDVPLWLYIASNLTMRLHGEHAFRAFPMVVRVGGMLNVFGPTAGQKTTHPDTGDVTLTCQGFNDKNHYDRQTPCDHDYLRKLSKDTDATGLMRWFNTDVVKIFRRHRAFDKDGIFIGDGSYLFVPDNPKYEGSIKMRFDEHNHPVSKKAYDKMTAEQKSRCQWRRCYKMVTLLHTNRQQDFYLFVGLAVLAGNANECPVLYSMVQQFVDTVGNGVMKRLILDRGFLDGEAIATCKSKHAIDVLIPIRRKMDIYDDAIGLFRQPDVQWTPFEQHRPTVKEPASPRPRPKAVERRERKRQQRIKEMKKEQPPPPPDKTVVKTEVSAIGEFRSWSSCSVPLTVVANRETYADGHIQTWFLLDTQDQAVSNPAASRQDYRIRTSIEERYRQLKCFSDLTNFTSRAFSMVVNQVVFIMLAYNLLQLFLLRQKRKELTKKTTPGIRQQLVPSASYIIVYYNNCYGLFSNLEFMELMTIGLSDEARKKVGEKSRRLRRELDQSLLNPRPP
jgi:hypothetical protein